METSVIICTRNRKEQLGRCLITLAEQSRLPDEVLVVDAGDNPHEVRKLCESFDNLHVRYFYHFPPSSARQRNVAIRACTGEIAFFFDDDVELEREYMENVLEVYKDHSLTNIGGVLGLDLNTRESFLEGRKRLLFHRLFLLNRADRYARLLPSGNVAHLDMAAPEIRHAERPVPVNCMPGCLMSLHRKAFSEFLFDERYDGYSHGEDVELTHRVSLKFNLFFTPYARAYHNQNMDKKNWYGTESFVRSNMKAHMYLFQKHLRHNPLNYLAILWSWLGLLVWSGVVHPNREDFAYYLRTIRSESLNIFRRMT